MKLAILSVTKDGKQLGARLAANLESAVVLDTSGGVAAAFAENWDTYTGFICIMASGIVVRAVAPLLADKRTDPCVIVLDQHGRHVISLLSGHLGGGNALAEKIAEITGGTAIITTASDSRGLVALDLWAKGQNLAVSSSETLTRASALLVERGRLNLYYNGDITGLPPGIIRCSNTSEADIIVTEKPLRQEPFPPYSFHPQNLVIGVGCNRGTPIEEFEDALFELLEEYTLSIKAVRNLASITVKNDEEGLLLFAEKYGWPIHFFTKEELNNVDGITFSQAAMKAVGAKGVAEPSAHISAQTNTLLCRKRKWKNITMAMAQANFSLSAQVLDPLTT